MCLVCQQVVDFSMLKIRCSIAFEPGIPKQIVVSSWTGRCLYDKAASTHHCKASESSKRGMMIIQLCISNAESTAIVVWV